MVVENNSVPFGGRRRLGSIWLATKNGRHGCFSFWCQADKGLAVVLPNSKGLAPNLALYLPNLALFLPNAQKVASVQAQNSVVTSKWA